MTRFDILKARLLAIGVCFWLIVDLLGNLILSVVTMVWAVATKQEGAPPCAFETMSARAGRGMVNRKWPARVFGWCVDKVFAIFQGPVIDLPDGRKFEHPSHCVRAMVKTRHGTYLPHEYHQPLPPAIEAGYSE
ncbi:MAG: hypothetical protein V4669_13565 [Pseudomonadota bacterium]